MVEKTRWIGCRPRALLHLPAAVRARRREGGVPCRLDLQSCTWPFLGQQGVHAAAAFRGGVCGGYLVVLLLVPGEEEDVAVEEEREVIYSNCQIVCGIALATIIWKAWPPISHVPTQLDYVCLRTVNPLEVDFFNLYFGSEKLERMVGSTKAYVEDHFDNYSSYQTTVAHGLLWHSLSFFRNCRLCGVLLGQQTGTRIFCSGCKRGGKTTPLCMVISQENQCCRRQWHSAECDNFYEKPKS